jgi:hypothetical protein
MIAGTRTSESRGDASQKWLGMPYVRVVAWME